MGKTKTAKHKTPAAPPSDPLWEPAGLDLPTAARYYAVVEEWVGGVYRPEPGGGLERDGGTMTIEFSDWPRLDRQGRLYFSEDEDRRVVLPARALAQLLAIRAARAEQDDAPRPTQPDPTAALPPTGRPPRVGDVYAVTFDVATWERRPAQLHGWPANQTDESEAELAAAFTAALDAAVGPQIYDVTLPAREAAKIALFATLAPPIRLTANSPLMAAMAGGDDVAQPPTTDEQG